MNGPDPNKRYRVSEINLNTGAKSTLPENGRVFSGETIMEQGLKCYLKRARTSSVLELEAV
jgi:alpha-galactosidase